MNAVQGKDHGAFAVFLENERKKKGLKSISEHYKDLGGSGLGFSEHSFLSIAKGECPPEAVHFVSVFSKLGPEERGELVVAYLNATLGSDSLSNQAERLFSSVCDACISYNGAIDNALAPSIEYLVEKRLRHIIKLNGQIDIASLFALAPIYESKLIYFTKRLPLLCEGATPPLHKAICRFETLETLSDNELFEFNNSLFIERFRAHLTSSTLNNSNGFLTAARSATSVGYRKNGALVGLLLAEKRETYPYVDRAGVHIGFFGYRKELLSIEESRSIKTDAVCALHALNQDNRPYSAAIDYFNFPSHAIFKKMNVKPEFLWLEPRAQP